MNTTMFLDWEGELKLERCRKYIGSASVSLGILDFQHEVDEQNVDRLARLLQSKCDRADVRNHVIATIDQHSLDLALSYSNLATEDLTIDGSGNFPELNLPPKLRLQCLHGVDRLAAAQRVLPHEDQRWTVDLYLAGILFPFARFSYVRSNTNADLSSNLRLALTDSYSHEKEPLDGEFYTKIREYQLLSNSCLEEIWWSRLLALSAQKKRNLVRILRSSKYLSAFDCQMYLPGLQAGMKLGTMHTILAMKSDEV